MKPVLAEARFDWRKDAACQDKPVAWFFGTFGGSARDMERGKTVCQTCPVRAECLAYALSIETADSHRYGVWGGLSADERAALGPPASRLRYEMHELFPDRIDEAPFGHGTRYSYTSGCHCEYCREAERVYQRARRAANEQRKWAADYARYQDGIEANG